MTHDRTQLKRTRRVAQVVAAVSVIGAGVVAAMGLPGITPASAISPLGVDQPPTDPAALPKPETQPAIRYDSALIFGQLDQVANAPKPPAPQPNEEEVLAGETEPIEVTPVRPLENEPGIRYIGRIASKGNLRAILVIEEAQRLMSIGRVHEGIELLEIEPDHVIVDHDGERKRIDLEGATLTRVQTASMPDTIGNAVQAQPDRRASIRANQQEAAKTGAAAGVRSATAASLAGLTGEERERRIQEIRERQMEMGIEFPERDDR